MVIPIDAEKASDKIKQSFSRETLSKLEIAENLIKGLHKTPAATVTLNTERLNAFPLGSGTRQGCPPSPQPLNVVLPEVWSVQ